MIHYLQDDFKKAIAEEAEKLREYLALGKAENFDRYKEVVGQIRGLKQSLEIMTRVAKMHGDIDDD